MTARAHTTKVWQEAARDLGFEFVPGFGLQVGSDLLAYLGLVRGFGSAQGMLVVTESDYDRYIHAAQEHGFGYSCLDENFEPYDRETFVEILNDWGWAGLPDDQPSWYAGEP